ncbi:MULTISPECIES: cyclopropane-fatty-acyl-phospholipid synthase [Bacteroidales]|uniref:cyclopropane-fatty-acyl-phospholipid synthase n=1 Tax=Bacteroidales TaxID=171549 RepID=UPI001F2801F4|nr:MULTISPECIES: cyclopropane-fatty-acyl-phospholipid synthase [Bacteroides]MCE9246966.1 cyclopropane-fatty-acyl-phospholipid synthase [Bacteroides thetaiotaomicron]MDK7650240.1 cyclopropane-fatty-acyl-phospholipid synthase [Bacteroides fragilis]MDK7684651.1 cyclopropane-fatty-acyl-phospholipid synthase [Bacteroides fragilis]
MENDYVIENVGWFADWGLTDDYMDQQCRFFENYVRFLQENGFTTRIILNPNEKANYNSEIKVSDLTNEGLEFFKYGIIRWRKKLDRAKDREKAISDFKFINKKLEEFNAINKKE